MARTSNLLLRSRFQFAAVALVLGSVSSFVACDDTADDGGGAGETGSGGSGGTGGSGATGGSGGSGASGDSGGSAGENAVAGSAGIGGDDGGDEEELVHTCTRAVDTDEFGIHGEETIYFVPVCELDFPVAHVKVEGLYVAPNSHTSAQLLFGADSAPASAQVASVAADELLFLAYSGGPAGPSMTIPPQISLQVGATDSTLDANTTWLTTSSTVCFDLFPGDADEPPHFVLWQDGEDGADCDDLTTLTYDNAALDEVWWDGELGDGAISDTVPYFRQTGQAATITLSDETALDPSELPAEPPI